MIKNKKGMGVPGFLLLAVVFMVIVGVGVYIGVSQSAVKTGTTTVATNNCETSPFITLSGLNASTQSQTLAPTYYHRVNSVYKGTLTSGSSGSTFSLDDKVEILASLSGYKDIILPEVVITKCASNEVTFTMDYDASGGTFRIFNSDHLVLQDAELGLTGNNQSAITYGTSKTVTIELTSGGKQNIDPTWISMELTNKSNVKNLVWTGKEGVVAEEKTTPDFFSSENTTTTGYTEFARISGLKGNGVVNQVEVTIEASSTGSYNIDATSVFVNGYSEQAFVDVDGSFVTGQIEDADNTVKYDSKYTDYDFHIT
jgi:hypothetical protein